MRNRSYSELRHRHTLIVGDVGAGKTQLTRELLLEAVKEGESITILDFAPSPRIVDGIKIGGYLLDSDTGIRCLRDDGINTPRLSARDPETLIRLADENHAITSRLIKEYIRAPTPVLFINDTSIHLQRGEPTKLLEAITLSQTTVANGYLGEGLREDYGSKVSEHERANMEALGEEMDLVIKLNR